MTLYELSCVLKHSANTATQSFIILAYCIQATTRAQMADATNRDPKKEKLAVDHGMN